MSFKTVSGTLASAVASGGTFTANYPAGFGAGDFLGGYDHILVAAGGVHRATAGGISLSFGASNITVTYNGSTTLPAGTDYRLQIDEVGDNNRWMPDGNEPNGVSRLDSYVVNLGAPITADADGVSAVQTLGSAGDFTIGGALASGGVATFDVPRNVTLTGATTDHSARTFTITGTDEFGNAVVEELAGPNNSTVSGKKAFKTVTQVAVDGAISTNGVSVGCGDVLGLPIFLAQKGHVLSEMEDGAAATAGTIVAGVSTAATATTGDVRGTYDPNSACNGSKVFQLIVALGDPSHRGVSQYAG